MPTKTQEKKTPGPSQAKQGDELTQTEIKQTDTQTDRQARRDFWMERKRCKGRQTESRNTCLLNFRSKYEVQHG